MNFYDLVGPGPSSIDFCPWKHVRHVITVLKATSLRDRYTTPIQHQVSIKFGYSLVEI